MAAFNDGYKVVTSAGTAVALSTDTSIVKEVTVIALDTNTTQINVGDSGVIAATGATHRGVGLLALDAVTFKHVALSELYIDSRTNGEGCTFVWTN
jgi:hypothetical protein